MSEVINHPDHYKTGKFECIEVMKEIFGADAVKDFCKLNAFKYLWRSDRKNGKEDLLKAKWYLDTYLLSEDLNPYLSDPDENEPQEDEKEKNHDETKDDEDETDMTLIDTLVKGLRFMADMSDEDNDTAKRYAIFQQKVKDGYPERVSFWMAMVEDITEDDDEQ